MDEYIGYVRNVLDGNCACYEITLNATSVYVKENLTIAEHHYLNEEPYENTMETMEFLELMFIWREKLV